MNGKCWHCGAAAHDTADCPGRYRGGAVDGAYEEFKLRGGENGMTAAAMKTEDSAERFKVAVAGGLEFSRNAELVHELLKLGCDISLLAANVEDLLSGSGDAAWARQRLADPAIKDEFDRQVDAAIEARVLVLCPPCSRSLHLIAGAAIAAGTRLVVLLAVGPPELAYLQADSLCVSVEEVLAVVRAEMAAPPPSPVCDGVGPFGAAMPTVGGAA